MNTPSPPGTPRPDEIGALRQIVTEQHFGLAESQRTISILQAELLQARNHLSSSEGIIAAQNQTISSLQVELLQCHQAAWGGLASRSQERQRPGARTRRRLAQAIQTAEENSRESFEWDNQSVRVWRVLLEVRPTTRALSWKFEKQIQNFQKAICS